MTETNLAVAEGESAPPQLNESEVKAKRLGWVPKEDFKGDPDKHRSAEEFLERGETMLPFLKRDNDKLHQKLSVFERKLEEQSQTFTKFVEFSSKAEERAYKRAKSELEAKLDGAIETADVAGARQVRKEIAELDAAKPEPVKIEEPRVQLDPVIQTWIGENEWFSKDRVLNAAATAIYGALEAEEPGASKQQLLAETKRQVMEIHPKKFGINPNRDNAATVASPGGAPKKKTGKTFEDLPADAKAACTKFVKTIPGYTRDKYLKDYEWD